MNSSQNTTNPELSIIVPCYNEETTILNSTKKIITYMTSTLPDVSFELILVNDGSKDQTANKIQIATTDYNVVVPVIYDDNGGKGKAVREGILKAKGKYMLFMDADLSTDLSGIKSFMNEIKEFDMVIGSRRHPDSIIPKPQGTLRKLIGQSCVIITKTITRMNFNDTQCGFKGFKYELGKLLAEKQKIMGWAFDVEYLYIATIHHKTVKSIPVKWENDEDSKVSPIKSSISFFIELFKIISNKKYYKEN